MTTLPNTDSHHLPIPIQYIENILNRTLNFKKSNFKRVNWDSFTKELDININPNPYIYGTEVDKNLLVKLIKKSGKKSIPRGKPKRWISFW